jgi:hypothetical protein
MTAINTNFILRPLNCMERKRWLGYAACMNIGMDTIVPARELKSCLKIMTLQTFSFMTSDGTICLECSYLLFLFLNILSLSDIHILISYSGGPRFKPRGQLCSEVVVVSFIASRHAQMVPQIMSQPTSVSLIIHYSLTIPPFDMTV